MSIPEVLHTGSQSSVQGTAFSICKVETTQPFYGRYREGSGRAVDVSQPDTIERRTDLRHVNTEPCRQIGEELVGHLCAELPTHSKQYSNIASSSR